MNICVGSKNPVKIQAVHNVLQNHSEFSNQDITIIGICTQSNISEQPTTLAETIQGAQNRARNAFTQQQCNAAIGLESGWFTIPGTTDRYLNITACVIFDGTNSFYGLSSAFELPSHIAAEINTQRKTLTDICFAKGITPDRSLGKREGLIGVLSNGHITRQDLNEQALETALVSYLHNKN